MTRIPCPHRKKSHRAVVDHTYLQWSKIRPMLSSLSSLEITEQWRETRSRWLPGLLSEHQTRALCLGTPSIMCPVCTVKATSIPSDTLTFPCFEGTSTLIVPDTHGNTKEEGNMLNNSWTSFDFFFFYSQTMGSGRREGLKHEAENEGRWQKDRSLRGSVWGRKTRKATDGGRAGGILQQKKEKVFSAKKNVLILCSWNRYLKKHCKISVFNSLTLNPKGILILKHSWRSKGYPSTYNHELHFSKCEPLFLCNHNKIPALRILLSQNLSQVTIHQ